MLRQQEPAAVKQEPAAVKPPPIMPEGPPRAPIELGGPVLPPTGMRQIFYRGVKKPGEEFSSQGRWTTDATEAEGYAGRGGRVVSAYLNIKTPHSTKGNVPTVDDPIRGDVKYDGLIGEPFGEKQWAIPFHREQIKVLSEYKPGAGKIATGPLLPPRSNRRRPGISFRQSRISRRTKGLSLEKTFEATCGNL